MMSFLSFTLLFVQNYSCLYNKKKITQWLEYIWPYIEINLSVFFFNFFLQTQNPTFGSTIF